MYVKEHNIKMDIIMAEKLKRMNIYINIRMCMKEDNIKVDILLAEKLKGINICINI